MKDWITNPTIWDEGLEIHGIADTVKFSEYHIEPIRKSAEKYVIKFQYEWGGFGYGVVRMTTYKRGWLEEKTHTFYPTWGYSDFPIVGWIPLNTFTVKQQVRLLKKGLIVSKKEIW